LGFERIDELFWEVYDEHSNTGFRYYVDTDKLFSFHYVKTRKGNDDEEYLPILENEITLGELVDRVF
jgi:hypothetical protein